MDYKEKFQELHVDIISQYIEDNPHVSWDEAYTMEALQDQAAEAYDDFAQHQADYYSDMMKNK